MKQKQKRPNYTQEFKDSAVRLSTTSGKSIDDLAAELGISSSTLCAWRQEAGVSAPRGDAHALREMRKENEDLKRQLRDLQREKKVVEVEREILKKAAAFFAREQA
jgi:transposase-like protein